MFQEFEIVGNLGGDPVMKYSQGGIPFTNMSGDPEQEYFADGISEDLIAAISSWCRFPVIARNSSFIYKDRAVDVKQVGRELGARYLLEGSVRKSGSRMRIACMRLSKTIESRVRRSAGPNARHTTP